MVGDLLSLIVLGSMGQPMANDIANLTGHTSKVIQKDLLIP